ncbi:unnamed protein product [Bemisia tabaci]|uniref:Transcriptional adapter 1-like protein n=2 Tax=Bemisia tabaci TaxID=7038 RepID=A0A9P0C492_BEMTA|nr:unnamed protein product [Bemisia tabaci]
MTSLESINEARMELIEALGEFKDAYLCMMKQWFKMQISKKEFEGEIRNMLPQHQLHLHNRFILRLISSCLKSEDDTAKKRFLLSKKVELVKNKEPCEPPQKMPKIEEEVSKPFAKSADFIAAEWGEYLPERRTPSPSLIEQQHYASQELFLPDLSMIHGRMMLVAWELGLDGAESSAAEVLVTATQYFLKNLLTAVLCGRKGFKVRENRFIYSIGTPMPNPILRNYPDLTKDFHSTEVIRSNMDCQNWEKLKTEHSDHEFPREVAILLSSAIKPTLENERFKQRIMFEMACSSAPSYKILKNPNVTTLDIIEALNTNRNLIASHSIFSISIERMLARQQHPSLGEMEYISLV